MTIAMPDWLKAAQVEWSLERASVTHTSQTTRLTQIVDLMSWQWRLMITLPPALLRESGKFEALANRLVGGADTIAMHHIARPVPIGTMRGTPTLNATAAQFANQIQIAGAWDTSRQNKFPYSEEINGWASYWQHATSTNNATAAPNGTVTADLITESAANADHFADRYNSYGTTGVKVFSGYFKKAGRNVCLAMYGTGNNHAAWFDLVAGTATALTTGAVCGITNVGGGWYRCWVKANITSLSGPIQRVCLANDAGATAYTGDAVSGLYVWGLQLEDSELTDYIPTTTAARYANGTLKAGDMIGLSGQLLQVADDAVSNDSGVMTVNLVNRLRSSVTAGASVVWNRPTAEFYMLDTRARSSYSPGIGGGQAFEFVERVA